jgi:hypothetical protein
MIGLGLALGCCIPSVAQAATFNIANGDVAGLIAAIQSANTNGDASNTINLAPNGAYVLGAVAETPPEYNAPGAVGLPVIRRDLTINGNGATIQPSTAAGTPTFMLLAVSGRTASCGGAGCMTYPTLTLNQTILTGGSDGGLHLNSGNALVQGSTITQNTGVGGIANACGTLTLVNSTVSYNSANNPYGGGGIFLWGFSCAPGKPVANISFTTVFENSNPGWGRGNAIAAAFVDSPGGVFLKDSILASPSNPSEVVCNLGAGTLYSLGHNILGDAAAPCADGLTAPGDMIATNPGLGPVANNGGSAPTALPLPNSPAIDAVPSSQCSDVFGVPVTTDQRGVSRPQGSGCDIGSVEVVQFQYHVCLLYDQSKATRAGATYPVKLQLCDAAGHNLSSENITVHAVSVTQVSTTISGPVYDSGNANEDNDFRFDAALGAGGGYIFNLSTKGLTTGTYTLNFTVTGDTFVYAAPFQVK